MGKLQSTADENVRAGIEGVNHFHGFDYLRVIAMAAVIYVHGCDTNPTAESATRMLSFPVPCFLLMSAFLAQWTIIDKRRSYVELMRNKLTRLAAPFLAWSVVYLVVRLLKSFATGQTIDSDLMGCIFWGDAAHQLYFIPLLIYFFAFWIPPMRLAPNHNALLALICVVGIAVALFVEKPLNESLPANRYFIAKNLVWFPVGMLLALVMRRLGEWRRLLFWPSVVAFAVLMVTRQWNVYAITISLFLIACSVQSPPNKIWTALSAISFGIYLVHVLFIESFQFAIPRIGLPLESLPVTLTVIIASALASVILCLLLDRSPKTRWSVR